MRVGLPHREGTVVLAFDVSNSMRATDLKPTRLDAAKAAAKAFVDVQPSSIKIGSSPSTTARLITQQPTTDRAEAVVGDRSAADRGGDLARSGHLRRRSRAIAGKPMPSSRGPDARRPRQRRHRLLRLRGDRAAVRRREHVGPDAMPLPNWHRRPACTSTRSASAARRHGPDDRRLQRGDCARRADAAPDRVGHQRQVLQRHRLGNADAGLQEPSTCERSTDPKQTEVTALFAGVSIAAAAHRRRSCRWCGSGGWSSHVVRDARWRSWRCWSSRCCSAATCGSCAASASKAVRYSSVALIRQAIPKRSRWRRHVPVGLFLAAIAALAVGAARPRITQDISINKTSIILTLDVSGSMCATDVVAEPARPPRRTQPRSSSRNQVAGTRIGIIAFANFAQLIVPPTTRQGRADRAIDNLTTSRGAR